MDDQICFADSNNVDFILGSMWGTQHLPSTSGHTPSYYSVVQTDSTSSPSAVNSMKACKQSYPSPCPWSERGTLGLAKTQGGWVS